MMPPARTSELPPTARILAAVCAYYDLALDQLSSPSRKRLVVEARQGAMYLLYVDARVPVTLTGYLLGRDHSTAMHGIRAVAALIGEPDPWRTPSRGTLGMRNWHRIAYLARLREEDRERQSAVRAAVHDLRRSITAGGPLWHA